MSKKILVIDDTANMRTILKSRLEMYAYTVTVAQNGQEGLEKVRQETPDLILLDVMMPEMDGYEVLQKLKGSAETWSIPVIMLTAKGETSSIFKARDLMATDYIIKPFKGKDLLDMIKKYI